jgi:hypothetical protein
MSKATPLVIPAQAGIQFRDVTRSPPIARLRTELDPGLRRGDVDFRRYCLKSGYSAPQVLKRKAVKPTVQKYRHSGAGRNPISWRNTLTSDCTLTDRIGPRPSPGRRGFLLPRYCLKSGYSAPQVLTSNSVLPRDNQYRHSREGGIHGGEKRINHSAAGALATLDSRLRGNHTLSYASNTWWVFELKPNSRTRRQRHPRAEA